MLTARSKRSGAAAVEFALLSPLMVVMLVGLWEVGRMVEAQQVLNNAVREGSRQGSTGKKDADQVKAAVINYVAAAGFDTTGIVVTVTNVTTSTVNADPRTYSHLDHFKVEVSLPFNNVRWILLNRFSTHDYTTISPPVNLGAESHWYSMRDQPVVVSFSPPIE